MFLPEPEGTFALVNETKSLQEAAALGAIVITGDPGIGKSTVLAELAESTPREITVSYELGSFSTDGALQRAIAESETVEKWRNGTQPLALYLDGLDESTLRPSVIAEILRTELLRGPIEQLKFRVACRSANLSAKFESALLSIFPRLEVLEVAPLRRVDVATACAAEELDFERFLTDAREAGAEIFLAHPVMLRFLFDTYRRDGTLGRSPREILATGCEELAKESQPEAHHETLSVPEKILLAGRIAAVLYIAGRQSIYLGTTDRAPRDRQFITLDDCVGFDLLETFEFQVRLQDLRSTVATKLFTSHGPDLMGFAHATVGEFLAGRYLAQRGLSPNQLRTLLRSAGSRRTAPALRAVSAWVAAFSSRWFTVLASDDPTVLAHADMSGHDISSREYAVDRVFEQFGSEPDSLRTFFGIRFQNLAHDRLSSQLETRVKEGPAKLRELAIMMSVSCKLAELGPTLLAVALNEEEPLDLRVAATAALSSLEFAGNAELKPLIEDVLADDKDELRGYALTAVWPNHISVHEVLAKLSPPKRSNFFGGYMSFLMRGFQAGLSPRDLPPALKWAADKTESEGAREPLMRVAESILSKAWDHLDDQAVLEPFAQAALARLRNHEPLIDSITDRRFPASIASEDGKRRKLLEAMLPSLAGRPDTWAVTYGSSALFLRKDIPYWIGRLPTLPDDYQRTLATLIAQAYDRSSADDVDLLLKALPTSVTLRTVLDPHFAPIRLDSDVAARARNQYEEMLEFQKRRDERREGQLKTREFVERELVNLSAGDLDAWWRLNHSLRYNEAGYEDTHEYEADLRSFAGWDLLTSEEKSHVALISERVVREFAFESKPWEDAVKDRRHLCLYRAAVLALAERGLTANSISAERWGLMADLIVRFPSDRTSDLAKQLARFAKNRAPERVRESMKEALVAGLERGSLSFLWRLDGLWSEEEVKEALELLAEASPQPFGVVLRRLVANGSSLAHQFCVEQLHAQERRGGSGQERALIAAQILFEEAPDAGWNHIWPAFSTDEAFAKDFVELVSRHAWLEKPHVVLSEASLSQLVEWLLLNFPPDTDPNIEGAHVISTREDITHLRSSLLVTLRDRGTEQSVSELRRLAGRFPAMDWLQRVEREAEEQRLSREWRPPKPREILQICQRSDLRLVRSRSEMGDLIEELLDEYQAYLRGIPTGVDDLWNQVGTTTPEYSPKDEAAATNHLKRYLDLTLRQRGIVANREVVIRARERTDLLIDATTRTTEPGFVILSWVIEVKCCWNAQTATGIATQLVARYLNNSASRDGTFLVFCYHGGPWSAGDRRKDAFHRPGTRDLPDLADQAKAASVGGLTVVAKVLDVSLSHLNTR